MNWQDIPVTIRRNRRARRVFLRVRVSEGVEVVLPFRVSIHEVPAILERNSSWIAERMAYLHARGEGPGQGLHPTQIVLAMTGMRYAVEYAEASVASLKENGLLLKIQLPVGTPGATLLQSWLITQGKKVLVPLCYDEAQDLGIGIRRVQIRNQQCCWGSCSGLGTISLNAKLLFLEEALVRHVIRHELCHVAHRNHGADFWSALRRIDPRTDEHEGELRKIWTHIPAWSKWRDKC